MGMMNLRDRELLFMLRNNVGVSDAATKATLKAADRIEELSDKLAKALDGLRFADDGANHGAMTPTYSEHALRYILRGIRDRARAVLAELGEDT